MKRIVTLIAVVATLGASLTAFAATPCACKGKDCESTAQVTADGGTRTVYEREFNQNDLSHRF